MLVRDRIPFDAGQPTRWIVADGEVIRFSRGNKTAVLRKGGCEAILSLEEHGPKKTWLLTGYDVVEGATDGSGKFCTRHAPTQTGPTFSRPGLGADAALKSIIAEMVENATSPFRYLKNIRVSE